MSRQVGDRSLKELITEIQKVNAEYAQPKSASSGEIAPDLNKIQLDEMVKLVAETKIDQYFHQHFGFKRKPLNL